MFTYIRKGVTRTRWVAKNIKTNDIDQLWVLQSWLSHRIKNFFGWYSTGALFAFALSSVLTVMSLAIPLMPLWDKIGLWLLWPDHFSTVAMTISGLAFSLLLVLLMFRAASGYYLPLIGYLLMVFCNAAMCGIWFIICLTQQLTGTDIGTNTLIIAVIGVVFMAISIKCLNSSIFVTMMTLLLHNRVLRKTLRLQEKNLLAKR